MLLFPKRSSREGEVLTHAHGPHGKLLPGTAITMGFGDGRKATGKVVGVHRQGDLTLIKLDGKGPWPAVPLGTTADVKPGDPCLYLGYPIHLYKEGRPPLLRLGR